MTALMQQASPSQLLSALEESFIVLIVLTERNTQFERWTEDDRRECLS